MAGLLYVRTGSGGANPAVSIDDLGFTIPTGAGWTLLSVTSPSDPEGNSGQFTAREIRDSVDLHDLILAGSLEWSKDGASAEPVNAYVADYMLTQDLTDDFLDQTAGRLALPNGSTLPLAASGIEGETFWKSDTDSFYVHDGSDWLLVATASGVNNDHGALTGLADDDHTQYLLLSGNEARNQVTGSIDMGPSTGYFILPQATDVSGSFLAGSEGALAWDTDHDTLYAHNGTQWIGIAPASGIITDHGALDGLADDDHSQYALLTGNGTRNAVSGKFEFATGELGLPTQTDVAGTLTSANEGDIAWDSDDDMLYLHDGTNWITVVDMVSGVLEHHALAGLGDDDHTQYGLLAGNAARNPVTGEYDFTSGDLILPADGTLKGSPVEGNVEVKGGVLYTYDATRSKWLSVDRKLLVGSRKGNATDVYLRVMDNIAMSETGYRVLRDGTITGIFAQTDTAESWTFEIRKNDSATVIASLVISGAAGSQDTTVNVDVTQGDELQFYCNGTLIKSPVGGVELAWRTT